MYLSFTEAREFVGKLNFKTGAEFFHWATGLDPTRPPKPDTIPANPHQVYIHEWDGMSDFLGYERVAFYNREFIDFSEARKFARNLGLRSNEQWRWYIRGEYPELPERPKSIPTNPNFTYAGQGWQNWGDWLGYDGISLKREYRTFEEARKFARGLNLKRWVDWRQYVTGKMPTLPLNPMIFLRYRMRVIVAAGGLITAIGWALVRSRITSGYG